MNKSFLIACSALRLFLFIFLIWQGLGNAVRDFSPSKNKCGGEGRHRLGFCGCRLRRDLHRTRRGQAIVVEGSGADRSIRLHLRPQRSFSSASLAPVHTQDRSPPSGREKTPAKVGGVAGGESALRNPVRDLAPPWSDGLSSDRGVVSGTG